MSERTVILVRHGRTVGNTERQLAGHFDTPLTEIGHRQARLIAARLGSDPMLRGAHVQSSDLQRARHTAAPIAEALGANLETFPELREICFGDYEGLTSQEFTPEIEAHFAGFIRGDIDWRAPGGESVRDVMDRMMGHLEHYADQAPLVIVTHGVAITSALCGLTGVPFTQAWADRRFEHVNTAWTQCVVDAEGRLRPVSWNIHDHLDPNSEEGRDPWAEAPSESAEAKEA